MVEQKYLGIMKIYNYIEGYGKDYLACSDGFIYSDKKKTRVKLKGQLLNSGYLTVDLCWKGTIKKTNSASIDS